MSFWTNKDRPTILSDAEDLAHAPEPSPWTKWFMGCVAPAAVLVYCLCSIRRGGIWLPGRGASMMVRGEDVLTLASAYMALAVFAHAHCFWNLHEKLHRFAALLKGVSLLVFLACIMRFLYHYLVVSTPFSA